MLSFVDQAANVKVLRVIRNPAGQLTRERLGLVKKRDFSLDDDLKTLDKSDTAEINAVIDFYRQSAEYERLAAFYRIPITLREAVEHVTTAGTRMERDMLTMSLVEALRLLRKADKADHDDGEII